MGSIEYLDAVKSRHCLASDYALAKLLGLSHQQMSNYRQRRNIPDVFVAFKIAAALDLDARQVVADLEAERAESQGKPGRAWEWRELAARLGKVAAAVAGAVILSAPPLAGNSSPDTRLRGTDQNSTMYTSSRRNRRSKPLVAMAETLAGRMLSAA